MSRIFESGRFLLRQTGQLKGKIFLQITVILGLNGENLWLLKSEEFSLSQEFQGIDNGQLQNLVTKFR